MIDVDMEIIAAGPQVGFTVPWYYYVLYLLSLAIFVVAYLNVWNKLNPPLGIRPPMTYRNLISFAGYRTCPRCEYKF
jgi:hypothetical protein